MEKTVQLPQSLQLFGLGIDTCVMHASRDMQMLWSRVQGCKALAHVSTLWSVYYNYGEGFTSYRAFVGACDLEQAPGLERLELDLQGRAYQCWTPAPSPQGVQQVWQDVWKAFPMGRGCQDACDLERWVKDDRDIADVRVWVQVPHDHVSQKGVVK